MNQFIRRIAYKVWIKDLLKGDFIYKESELDSSHILINNKRVSRVNIIATVIQKYENEDLTYASLTVDDGSADIRLKAWSNDVDLISNFMIGDLIMIIGRVKKYNDEIYILPEIVKKANPNWELVHKSILLQEPTQEIEEQGKEEIIEKPEEIRFDDKA